MSLDRNLQINATATKHCVTSSQHHETHPTAHFFGTEFVYRIFISTDYILNIFNSHNILPAQCCNLMMIRKKSMLLKDFF